MVRGKQWWKIVWLFLEGGSFVFEGGLLVFGGKSFVSFWREIMFILGLMLRG